MSLTLFGLVTSDCLSCSDTCSARMCTGYDPCRAAELMLLAAVCRLYLSRSGMRIVTTVHFPLFPPFDEGFGHINLFELSVIGVAKVSYFKVMCHALGRIPTVDEAVDLPCVELLNETALLLEKMGLLDFVKSANPFKVEVEERTLVDNEDELNVNAGKWKKRVAFVSRSPPMKKARDEGLDVTSSSVTPTPERVLEDAFHDNVVLPVTSASTGVNAPVAESAGDGRRLSSFRPEAGALSITLSQGSFADELYEQPAICQNLLDHVTPLGYWAALRNQHDAAFLDVVNIDSAQHVCMISELRFRYEH
nr:hypothetical protein [Tanacetum cinerariifolium]